MADAATSAHLVDLLVELQRILFRPQINTLRHVRAASSELSVAKAARGDGEKWCSTFRV
jgi:hypothetical protein